MIDKLVKIFREAITWAFAGALFGGFFIGLFYFCVYLGYIERKKGAAGQTLPVMKKKVQALFINLQRFVEIFVDLALVVVSYFVAYVIRFESGLPDLQFQYFVKTLPIVWWSRLPPFTILASTGRSGAMWACVII